MGGRRNPPPPPPFFQRVRCGECDGRGLVFVMRGLFRIRHVAERCERCHGDGTITGRTPDGTEGC